ncbi:MAG TPA: alpha-glucosidase C-terminal domain-containing protein, partial [Anaerolineales bacterium]|nr:alpha-glucosidase C-terminal domain-containing protein [Anaerolineales bacterium]
GTYDILLESHEEIYAFTRTLEGDRLLVILNFSRNSPIFYLPVNISYSGAELLISNYNVDINENTRQITLRPFEARVYRLK